MRTAQEILRDLPASQQQRFSEINTQDRLKRYVRSLQSDPACTLTNDTVVRICNIVPLIQILAEALEYLQKETNSTSSLLWSVFALSVQVSQAAALPSFQVLENIKSR